MSYSCLEELQVDLDLHALDKTSILSKAGCKYDDGWLVVTNDGICHLFDKDGNLDDIKKVTCLEKFHIHKDVTKIVIPDYVSTIFAAFYNCYNLKDVIIPNNVTEIKNYSFYYCKSLTSITIPPLVSYIGNYAFYHCTSLKHITLNNNIKYIGQQAFDSCKSLTSITIPASVTTIRYYAFENCINLQNVTILNNAITINYSAFICCNNLKCLTFKGKTLEQVKKMNNYPWGIEDESIIQVE